MATRIIIINDIMALFLVSPSLNAITLTPLLNLSLTKYIDNRSAIKKINVFMIRMGYR